VGITRLLVISTLVLASVALITAHHLRAAHAGAASLVPAHFAPALGWQVREGRAHACVGVPASRCSRVTSTASTTRFRDCLECLPHGTVSAMHAKDIAIQLMVARSPFEGLPARIGVYQGATLIGRREVSVFIVFGRAAPTNRQLKRANAELRRARFR
jgi:hypothetical protein